MPGKVFLAMLEEAGFEGAELVKETGLDSSPVTRGTLIRARKSARQAVKEEKMPDNGPMSDYKRFFEKAYAPGAMDVKMKHLVALGASLGSGCDP